ncbi:MAG: aspartate kinase [Coriobacteriia bacterium]|nr:aspartate kinase [Coriobacteriia bacterium]
MALIVTKFGGTSVGTTERIRSVANRLIAMKERGDDVLAVVSAMGKETDRLLDLAHQITGTPSTRELDMLLTTGEQVSISLLAMAIQAKGYKAVSFTGPQVGIITDDVHTKAKITAVDAACVRKAIEDDMIVVVAGFQGKTPSGQITTLGRGGSDTTAVALAAGLNADICEIYTDVSGVFTADPRIVPRARKIDEVSYEEMLEMASSGAGVLSMRSVEFARNHGVTIHCRSSFSDENGTIVKKAGAEMEHAIVSGVTYDTSEAKVTIRDCPDTPGVAARVFNALARENVNVDMIIQNVSEEGLTDISFTTPESDLPRARKAIDSVAVEIGARTWGVQPAVAKISIVGAGMRTNPGVTAKMFTTLAQAGVNIDIISTSPIRLSCVIALADVETAVRALHTAFGLDETDVVVEVASEKQN